MLQNPGFDILGKVTEISFQMFMSKKLDKQFAESFRPNQIKCKSWLVEEISKFGTKWDNVLVLGSWNSILLYELMKYNCNVGWYDFVDINPIVHKQRDLYFDINNMEKNYNSIQCDALDYSEPHSNYDLVINCSCEHMKDISADYGPTYALQSNDYEGIKGHINLVESTEELALKNNITDILYQDSMKMENYTRFMVIGYYY